VYFVKSKEAIPTSWIWNEKYNLISLADHPFLFVGFDKTAEAGSKLQLVRWDSPNICVIKST